jgi:hypothetical protein
MKTEHNAICACCDSPVTLSVDDDEKIGWVKPCPIHGAAVRLDAVHDEIIARHRAQQPAKVA